MVSCFTYHVFCFGKSLDGASIKQAWHSKLGIFDMGGLDPNANQWLEWVLP
jgi:hypothetical protein